MSVIRLPLLPFEIRLYRDEYKAARKILLSKLDGNLRFRRPKHSRQQKRSAKGKAHQFYERSEN